MKCARCGNSYATEIGSCPYCIPLSEKPGRKLGQDFISRLFAGDIPHGTPLGTRYEIEELLGRGGMGIVYRAIDKVLHEKVAIKLLNPLFSSDKDIIERFKQEIKLARKINHRNVIKIYDMGDVDGIRYISMEYVQGKDLKEVIRAEAGPLPLNFAIMIIRQIVEALQVAHDLSIIHRDIKPQNILIQKNGEVKILDFGIARLSGSDELTRTGSLLGSPVYMSPEQASGKDTDHRSDIYSLGVIMFEVFTGRIPFLADTPIATALKHVNEQPPLPTSLNSDLPIWVEGIILKAMEKDLDKRFQNVIEINDPAHGLTTDRLVDADIVVCPHCGKRNPDTNLACTNCHSFLGVKPKMDGDYRPLQDEEMILEEQRLMKSAAEAYREGNFSLSEDRLHRILLLNEANLQARQMLKEVEQKKTIDKRINLYHQNALISYQDKKFDDAISLWEKILTLDPHRTDVENFLKRAREEQDIYSKIKGHINKGLQAYNQNNFDDAISHWEKAIEFDPRNVEAAFYISKAQTLINFEKRCQLLSSQADTYIDQGDYDNAISCYQQLAKLDRENLSISLKLDELQDLKNIKAILEEGLDLYLKHQYEEAVNCWNQVFAIDPDNNDARNYVIQARARINESVKVKEIFRIGLVHFRDRRWKQAISRFEDVRKFEGPYQRDAIKYIGLAQEQLEKENRISKLLQEGLSIYQQENQDQANRVWAVSAAIKQWEKILDIDPNHREALDYIAKAKLIIKRSNLLLESSRIENEKTNTDTDIKIVPTAGSLAKPRKKRVVEGQIKAFPELREYVVGAVMGGAVGDALGLGTTWVARDDGAEDNLITSYTQNIVGRFNKIPLGVMSGEMELTLKTASSIIEGDLSHPREILKSMLTSMTDLAAPLEQSSETFFHKLRSGVPWKDAVLMEEDNYAPLNRAALLGAVTFQDTENMFSRVRTLTLLTHKHPRVLACCLAMAFAVSRILRHRNEVLRSSRPMIGASESEPIVWESNEFLKSLSGMVETYDTELADQIMELIIYATMPADRFFDTVGISDNVVETLLSSFYCFLRYTDNFHDGIVLAINSRGFSRNISGNRHGIAGLTGFLCGAFDGFIQIPPDWINGLKSHKMVFNTAINLHRKHFPTG